MGDGGSRSLLFCFGGAANHAGQQCSLARYSDPCTSVMLYACGEQKHIFLRDTCSCKICVLMIINTVSK